MDARLDSIEFEEDGGADKDRTCDLLNAIQALYQLSYDPIQCGLNLMIWLRMSKREFLQLLLFCFNCRSLVAERGFWCIYCYLI